jgi:hypothetical protein
MNHPTQLTVKLTCLRVKQTSCGLHAIEMEVGNYILKIAVIYTKTKPTQFYIL